ncbi:MAG TPA: cupin domain-containing protein [Gemmatimonadota bacterium]|nr:cupin domain-containing protein [Gemmatimonadota bacterium]
MTCATLSRLGTLLGVLALALPASLAAQEAYPETMTARQKAALELDKITPEDVAHWGVRPGAIGWIEDPDVAGIQVTYLLAEPTGGPYVFRLKLPDGFDLESHAHPRRRLVTVLQGTYHVGFGDTPDRAKTAAFPAGSYFVIPAAVPHFAWSEGETVLEVVGSGNIRFDWTKEHR